MHLLDEKSYVSPAFANGRIYIRGNDNLYCIAADSAEAEALEVALLWLKLMDNENYNQAWEVLAYWANEGSAKAKSKICPERKGPLALSRACSEHSRRVEGFYI